MDWIQLLSAVGLGAIVTKVLDVTWLQRAAQEATRSNWLRDQRLRAYSALTKELISHGRWSGTTKYNEGLAIAADAMLVSNERLASRIDDHFRDVDSTLDKLRELQREAHLGDAAKAAERAALSKSEFERLNNRARDLVAELRDTLLHK